MGHKTAVSRPLPASTLLLDRSTPRVNLIQGRRVFLRLRCISYIPEFEDLIYIPPTAETGGRGWENYFHFPFCINIRCPFRAIPDSLDLHEKKRYIKDIYDPVNGFETQIED